MDNYWKNILSILVIYGFVSSLYGQDTLSMNGLLETAITQDFVLAHDQKLAYQTNTDYTLPWIEELEFRTETNDFIFRQQEYAFRTSINTNRQRKAQQQYHQATINRTQTERQLALKDALLDRYEWLLDWLKVKHTIEIKNDLKQVYLDKIKVLRQTIDDSRFDIEELVEAEEELLEVDMALLKLQDQQIKLSNQLPFFVPNIASIDIDTTQLVTAKQIKVLMTLEKINYAQHSLLLRKQNRIDLTNKEYNIELSKIRNPINFVQLKASGKNNVTFREIVSVSLGLQLPFKGDTKLDLNELELDKIEETQEYQILQAELEENERRLKEQITQLLDQQAYFRQQIANSQTQYTLDRFLEIDGANPLPMLELKEMLLKKEQAAQKVDFQVLDTFLEWLDVSDKIMEAPLRNHLSIDQDLLKMN